MDALAERLEQVRHRIAAAARAAGREPDAVRLIAVSKRMPAEAIRLAYAAGQRDFGENYVQELQAKATALADLADLRLHHIGHLQRNKARQVVQHASSVQSVDSAGLAEELGKRAAACPVPAARRLAEADAGRLVVLVEVNVGGEDQKSGCAPEELTGVLAAVEAQPALALRGLMTVPPYTDDPAESRPYFDALARLRAEHGGPARLPELSMGMTHDLEHAVAAGATQVRVGTAIFGLRPPVTEPRA